ncbi:MAG: hypothetical protein B7X86_07250 [Sphingobacteriales bacterium 17-39-43]|uniref:hypothetical protein n=1 Tax=Daejeonella sp. TaxID=2805397 RepID=UPI000BC56DF5|nr:hypothetical protein [Daejeonella sp.]OYZ31835.1 MAG: hypothetical protein B7Y24_08375 [Sphingobacteriales bacterium 16-39-50]OYZ59194.1 MAG: hypothetical protein B7Y19_01520 [Sphingobacteriales bacterium 24-40-4]OZA24840.1 MAG: hypothetical protein B7X86_07250 [Sphingobacteriales bacterium 17-39-43]HQS04976.1 hypothetical protein [Daejeonella sp.]HQS51209.1 hypothetical protein [Daejeonella sp.]
MKTFNILILAVLLASCNTQVKETETNTSAIVDKKNTAATNCYLYAGLSDTVSMNLTHLGDSITGYLVYNFKEKDKNTGTINGRMNGNILIAEYTFLSEGIQSCRQVAFKLEGDKFIEGYGESYSRNDRFFFKYPDSLNFDSSYKLRETDCL